MSWAALKWALLKRIKAPQKSTLITLARRQPDDLRAFASPAATLAGESGLSLGGLKLSLRNLEAAGLLVIIPRQNRPNLYDLQLSCATHDVGSNDVGSNDVSSNDVGSRQSPGGRPASHEVTTNKQSNKQLWTNTSSAKTEKLTDPRFQEFLSELKDYWTAANPGIPFEFGPKDGKALNGLLSGKQTMGRDRFRTCLTNRLRSDDVNHCQEFHTWISRVTNYEGNSLNKYGQPKGATNGASQGPSVRQTTAERNRDLSRQAIFDGASAIFGAGFGNDDGPDSELFSAPVDPERYCSGLDEPLGRNYEALRPGNVQGRLIEGR